MVMAPGLASAGQADFGAGIYRGREAPDNAAYDLLNFLIDEEGQPFRRGGSAYKSTSNTAGTILGLGDLVTPVGTRTLWWSATEFGVLDVSDVAPSVVITSGYAGADPPPAFARIAGLGGVALLPDRTSDSTATRLIGYAGSRKQASYAPAPGPTFSNGSATVTRAGGGFTANVDPGMIVAIPNSPTSLTAVVKSVESDTSLTLTAPFTGTGGTIEFTAFWHVNVGAPVSVGPDGYVTAAGGRSLVASGNRVAFSVGGNPFIFLTDDYHDLPTPGCIIGIEGLGDTALVFTASGVWSIGNLAFDAIDDVGNDQHVIRQLNRDVILWGDSGLEGFAGALVVPGVDDVYLMGLDGSAQPVGQGIRPLYRSYVKAGYSPGRAAVYRGHYFLPVVNGTTLVDVLICRLDRGAAWTRWAGHGAGIAYAQRIGSAARSPKLFSVSGLRITDLTDAWAPSASNASEANGTTHAIALETRDYPTPAGRLGSTTQMLRVRYEAVAAATPSITAKFSRGLEGSAYTTLTNLRGGAAADGLDESVWTVRKKAPSIRFRIESASALSSFTLRSVEARYTPNGAR